MTKSAKKLLRSNIQPKNDSERMILNSYHAMQLIKNRSDDALSPELIMEIHRTITGGLMEDPDTSGRFRDDDSIAVKDAYDDIRFFVV